MQIKGNAGNFQPMHGAIDSSRQKELEARLQKISDSDIKADAKLKEACREMEAVFLNILLARMRATVPKSGLIGDTSKEDMVRSLLDSELTRDMAKAGGTGLADMLYRQLTFNKNDNPKSQAPQ